MKPADLRSTLQDGVLIAGISGEIDMSNVPELRDAMTASTPNDAFGIVLDLSEVEFIDSAGIHLIYRLRETLRTRGQNLAIVIPPGSIVNAALRLAGIDRSPEVVETCEEAIRVVNPEATGTTPGTAPSPRQA